MFGEGEELEPTLWRRPGDLGTELWDEAGWLENAGGAFGAASSAPTDADFCEGLLAAQEDRDDESALQELADDGPDVVEDWGA